MLCLGKKIRLFSNHARHIIIYERQRLKVYKGSWYKMRKNLVTIQKVIGVRPIKGADRIEVAQVLDWEVVVRKDEFKVGDLCVYFEVDSFLPVREEFEFLRASSYRENDYVGKGFRIKTQMFRGQLSQGLLIPQASYKELDGLPVGTEVSERLGVKKWDVPEFPSGMGTVIGDFPGHIPQTDEMRVQSFGEMREQLLGKPYYITTKYDGTSMSVEINEGKVRVYGRKTEMKDEESSMMWHTLREKGYLNAILEYGRNFTLQGELIGPKIQKNCLDLDTLDWYVFTMLDENHERVPLDVLIRTLDELNIPMVGIEEVGENFDYTTKELLKLAEGRYSSGRHKEGIVVRPQQPEFNMENLTELSFKVLNNKFLLKEK